MYKFNINSIDLRLRQFRTRKDYWQGVREGRIPPPRFGKPVLTAIKLDPKQAIITVCNVGGAYMWRNNGGPLYCYETGPGGACSITVRGTQKARRVGGAYGAAPS